MRFTDENSYIIMKFRVTESENLRIKAYLDLTGESFSDFARTTLLPEVDRRLGRHQDDL